MAKPQLKSTLRAALLFLGIFAFRSSLAEPYRVPSGSMEPTILPGDFLMVSKAEYGLRLPFTDHVLFETGEPARGDIVVFRYPGDPSINYVKRLIGLPGDRIEIRDGFARVNGRDLVAPSLASGDRLGTERFVSEEIDGKSHRIRKSGGDPLGEQSFRVPEGQYFFLGDNRDQSNDSRYWGFVPREALRGKARFVWLSLDWNHGWIPGVIPGIRVSRSGEGL